MTASAKVLLIVEDELPLLEAIVRDANKVGFQAISTRSVSEALIMLKEIPSIDAIWLDHYLPEGDGLGLMEKIHANKQWKSIPVFLVTNAIEPEIVNKYLHAGVKSYYTKMLAGPEQILLDIRRRLMEPPTQA